MLTPEEWKNLKMKIQQPLIELENLAVLTRHAANETVLLGQMDRIGEKFMMLTQIIFPEVHFPEAEA